LCTKRRRLHGTTFVSNRGSSISASTSEAPTQPSDEDAGQAFHGWLIPTDRPSLYARPNPSGRSEYRFDQ
jgi:hypothetical protein